MKVGDFLQMLIGMTNTAIPTRLDKKLVRPADVTLQIPCVDKFVAQTGWQAQYAFEESVEYLLDYWRLQAAREARAK